MIGKYQIDMAKDENDRTVYKIYDTEKDEMSQNEYTFMTAAILAAIHLNRARTGSLAL